LHIANPSVGLGTKGTIDGNATNVGCAGGTLPMIGATATIMGQKNTLIATVDMEKLYNNHYDTIDQQAKLNVDKQKAQDQINKFKPGAFLDNNDLSRGIVQAQESISDYYVLGYYTTNAN